jgi:phosphate acetyltransferase
MSRSLYLAPAGPETGKSSLALGLFDAMSRRVSKVGVFRPLVPTGRTDPVLSLIERRFPSAFADRNPQDCTGVSYDDIHADHDRAVHTIVERFRRLERQCDATLVVGTDYTDAGAPTELACNCEIALNLGAPVLLVVSGRDRTVEDLATAAQLAVHVLREKGNEVIATVANRIRPAELSRAKSLIEHHLREGYGDDTPIPQVEALPELPLLSAPSFGHLLATCDGTLLYGHPEGLDTEVLDLVVAAMTLPNALERLYEGSLVITPGDRADVLIGVLSAHDSYTFPRLSGVLLTGGLTPPSTIRRLVDGFHSELPVGVTSLSTFDAATVAGHTRGALTDGSPTRTKAALELFARHVDGPRLLDRLELARSAAVTPLMFEQDLIERARTRRTRIVLPEGTEPRVLLAAAEALQQDIAEIILLGDPAEVAKAAALAGADISSATVRDPHQEVLREQLAQAYVVARAHKGATMDLARDVVVDVSYAGALMVSLGLADGMVSGAVHTTAHTIRPAFEVIGRAPHVSAVSSVFFMCLADRVLVYGDCAVIPDPTPDQLADIAISSAATAEAFGIEPRVAMLSYSTGTSGQGAGVEKVREATSLVRRRRPELQIEGPIQYDAAVDVHVASVKLPQSSVAGRATVFVFPDLNTGNNTYKAVQRSAGALAVGPVLQGLRHPVNDLSRGATVADIATTIAITAVQAQLSRPEDRPPVTPAAQRDPTPAWAPTNAVGTASSTIPSP